MAQQALHFPGIKFSRSANEAFSEDFKKKICEVYTAFPEFYGSEIKCGALKPNINYLGLATSWTPLQEVKLQPDVGRAVIAHEFTHLLQDKRFKPAVNIPHGEQACDIWTYARIPVEWIDFAPTYLIYAWASGEFNLEKHKAEVKRLCREAIEYRKTHRQYIVWVCDQLEALHKADLKVEEPKAI